MHMVARLDDFDGFGSRNCLILFLHIISFLEFSKAGGSRDCHRQQHGIKRIFSYSYSIRNANNSPKGLTLSSLPQDFRKDVGIPKKEISPSVGHTLYEIESQLQLPEALFRDLRQVF